MKDSPNNRKDHGPLREAFEAAWQSALAGAAPPSIDSFLLEVSEPERASLAADLRQIEAAYQARASQGQMTLTLAAADENPLRAGGANDQTLDGGALASPEESTLHLPPDALKLHHTLPLGAEVVQGADATVEIRMIRTPEGTPAAAPPANNDQTLDCRALPTAWDEQTLNLPADHEPQSNKKTLPLPVEPVAGAEGTVEITDANKHVGRTVDSTLSPTKKAAPLPHVTVPGYEILSELGRGAMGVVYKAIQKRLNRKVALKMVLSGAHASPEHLARFTIEAQSVAQLQHPNIVQIYEVGEHQGLPYFSLEYVNGGTLSSKLGGKPLPPREAAQMVELLAQAMACAHGHGVIHRDLKPANVLLTLDGQPKISDFGLAKRLEEDSGQTKSGTLMGTPSYMAPEQARGDTKEVGPLADVYALGVILYELLTGRTPFVGASILDTLQQVRNREPLAPSKLLPKVPRDLDTVCLKCLEKETAKRYPSAEALADDLHRYLNGEPIKARPVGTLERAWRWCKRNPRVASLSGVVAALLITVGVVLGIMTIREAREAERIADAERRDREMLDEVRKLAEQRIGQAMEAIRGDRFRQAQVILKWSDPLVESREGLADTRAKLHLLRDQVDLYLNFKTLLDQARYYGLFGARGTLAQGGTYAREALKLYDEIEAGTGRGRCGMPPLDDMQKQLLREDYFEAFLVAAEIEMIAAGAKEEEQKEAAKKAVALLDRAEKLFPNVWVLFARRSVFLKKLGDDTRAQADREVAEQTPPTAPLDRFWYGIAEHMKGDALKDSDGAKAEVCYKQALLQYAELLQLRPNHFWAYFDGATCHFQMGNLTEARIGFTMCIQIRPEVAWPYYNRGSLLSQLKQHDPAIEDFTEAIERNKDYADAYLNRGIALTLQDKPAAALADFSNAIRVNPALTQAYYHRAELCRTKLAKPADAAADYSVVIEREPKNAAAYQGRGMCYRALADWPKARGDFAKLTVFRPKVAQNFLLHGEACLRGGDPEAALPSWRQLGLLLPKSADPPYYQAVTYKALNRYDDALKSVNQAIALGAKDPRNYLFRGQLYHQQGKLAEALADVVYAQDTLKDAKGETWSTRGDVLRTMRRLPEAASAYRKSIELLPKQTDAYAGLAFVHQLEGNPQEAGMVLDQLVAVMPESDFAYLRRAEFRRTHKQWAEALQDVDAAAKLKPESGVPPLVRLSIRAAQGEYTAAVAEADALLQSLPRTDGYVLATAASVWSLAAHAAKEAGEPQLADQYADRAAGLLADALRKGVLELNYQAVNRILVDPGFTPIHSHPRVLELLPVLKRPADKPAG